MYNQGNDIKVMISNEPTWAPISSRATEMQDLSRNVSGRVAVFSEDSWNIILMNFSDEQKSIVLEYGAAAILSIGLSMVGLSSILY